MGSTLTAKTVWNAWVENGVVSTWSTVSWVENGVVSTWSTLCFQKSVVESVPSKKSSKKNFKSTDFGTFGNSFELLFELSAGQDANGDWPVRRPEPVVSLNCF